MKLKQNYILALFCLGLFIIPVFSVRAEFVGEEKSFFVEKDYDIDNENQVDAVLINSSADAYIYIEKDYWDTRSQKEKDTISQRLVELANDFNADIHPKLTAAFGSEWSPGIDNDKKITILFHSMKGDVRGYMRTIDEYERTIFPFSNQREMVYLSTNSLSSAFLDEYFIHEFTHLIVFNQKEKQRSVQEDLWLNEAYAEYAVTLLGYNSKENAYIDQRIKNFIKEPEDSLVLWDNDIYDYGILSIFIHYLVDYYGENVLKDAIKSDKVGIESLNYALSKNGYNKTVEDIFTDWSVAVLINNCDYGEGYCFKNEKLKNLRITPLSNFLPFIGESSLSIGQLLTNYSAQWQKFTGGRDTLDIEFQGGTSDDYNVFYITQDIEGKYEVNKLVLDKNGKANIQIPDIAKNIISVYIIPSIFEQGNNSSFLYYIKATSIIGEEQGGEQEEPEPDEPEISLPFEISKPLSQMTQKELLIVVIRVILYLRGVVI